MDIAEKIERWDGKSADSIGQLYDQSCHEPGFTSSLIKIINKPSVQKGATWLLKKHLETGELLSESEVDNLYKALPKLEHWETKLHVLQIMPYTLIEKKHIATVEPFLRECLNDKNKFVRAWAYNGFNELASNNKSYQKEVDQLLETALVEEAPSVKARIRNIIKEAGKKSSFRPGKST